MNMFHCYKCQYKALSHNLLKMHQKYFHKDKKFTCDICGHQESRKQSLNNSKWFYMKEWNSFVIGVTINLPENLILFNIKA